MALDSKEYQTLCNQVAKRIASEVTARTWIKRLPGERALAESLNVSRKTLRKALNLLRRKGVIRTTRGLGHEIIDSHSDDRYTKTDVSVGLIIPAAIEHMRPFSALWIDALRSLLINHGWRLSAFAGPRFFSGSPERALEQLVSQNPQDSWILAHSNEKIQTWFHARGINCVIAGSSHPGLDLPNVDLDYFAVCRHAVGTLLRRGHRSIAFLTQQSKRAGDLESEAGFSAGARQSSHADVSPLIMRHDGTVDGVNAILARMFNIDSPPTAVLVANPSYYLTTATFLARRGLRIPEDVSLISRDDDMFLAYLNPIPARYSCSPKSFARRLLQLLLTNAAEGAPASRDIRIEVKFEAAGSLGDLKG